MRREQSGRHSRDRNRVRAMSGDDPLGLGALSDDQLAEMARHVAAEIVRRDPVVAAVAKTAVLDEAEKLQAARDGAAEAQRRWREAEYKRIYDQALERERAQIVEDIVREIGSRGNLLDPAEREAIRNRSIETARLQALRDERLQIMADAAREVRAALAGLSLIGDAQRRKIAELATLREQSKIRDEERRAAAENARRQP